MGSNFMDFVSRRAAQVSELKREHWLYQQPTFECLMHSYTMPDSIPKRQWTVQLLTFITIGKETTGKGIIYMLWLRYPQATLVYGSRAITHGQTSSWAKWTEWVIDDINEIGLISRLVKLFHWSRTTEHCSLVQSCPYLRFVNVFWLTYACCVNTCLTIKIRITITITITITMWWWPFIRS